MLATGRLPNIGPLKLENTNVIVKNNKIIVDDYSNTNQPGIYAIGDVIDISNLTPVAIMCGRILTERIFNNKT